MAWHQNPAEHVHRYGGSGKIGKERVKKASQYRKSEACSVTSLFFNGTVRIQLRQPLHRGNEENEEKE